MIFSTEEKEEDPEEGPHILGAEGDEEPPLMGLVGEITEAAAQQLSMALLGFNGGKVLGHPPDPEEEDVEFFISSGGGAVNDMFAIYDLMQTVKINRDIATFGYGRVYSAAVLLLAAGTSGKRYIAKNTRVMIHHCSANATGSRPDVRANFDELKKVEDMMVACLVQHSLLSAGEIYNMMSRNVDEYFSAEEALEMGIVDKII